MRIEYFVEAGIFDNTKSIIASFAECGCVWPKVLPVLIDTNGNTHNLCGTGGRAKTIKLIRCMERHNVRVSTFVRADNSKYVREVSSESIVNKRKIRLAKTCPINIKGDNQ